MYHFVINVAKHEIGIKSVYFSMYGQSKAFLSEKTPGIMLYSSEKEIEQEYHNSRSFYDKNARSSDVEMNLLLRKLADAMLNYDTVLMHGAVIEHDNNAYMFTAKSGVGKTTHIFKWWTNLSNVHIINGDKPLIIAGKEPPQACGTPWCGKERLGTNAIVPLKAIVFMDRAENNAIQPITFMQAFPRLLEQTHRPDDPELMRKTLQLLASLNNRVKFYHFDVNNFKDDSFAVSYEALTGQTLPKEI